MTDNDDYADEKREKTGGRQKGTGNKYPYGWKKKAEERRKELNEEWKAMYDQGVIMPLEFLKMVINNPDAYTVKEQLEAAKTLMPYLHQQMPKKVERKDEKHVSIEVSDSRAKLERLLGGENVVDAEYEEVKPTPSLPPKRNVDVAKAIKKYRARKFANKTELEPEQLEEVLQSRNLEEEIDAAQDIGVSVQTVKRIKEKMRKRKP